jgi:hypothetical protein
MIGRRAGALLRPVETVTVTSSRSIVVMDGPGPGAIGMFGKLGPRICKLLGGQGVQAKAALLGVMGSLAQVGAPLQNFVVRAFCSMILLKEYQILQRPC